MRIVAGKYKGRRFSPPKNLPVRPTTDFAKEGLFNILRSRFEIEGSLVLDLFAGSGNMSLEFISRGAEEVTAVEQDRNCVNFIQKISTELEIDKIFCRRSEVQKFLKNCGKYDLIFADPPYAFKGALNLIDQIFDRQLIKSNGYFILEHGKDQQFDDHPSFSFSRKFGNVNFTFFENEP